MLQETKWLPIDLVGLKKVQIEILDVVTEFCINQGIKYWLDSGTLLGAVRHKGYIPWDDDIDIGMLREDYDKFLSNFNNANDRYRVYTIENNDYFDCAYAKVLDTNTILYEPDKTGNKIAINIDIFVYDNAPDSDRLVRKMYCKRNFYNKCAVAKRSNRKPRGTVWRRLAVKILRMLCKPFPRYYFVKKIVANSKRFSNIQTKRVGNFTGYISTFACDKRVFNSFIDAEFEGKSYKIPIGYDEWLKHAYGDYMTLPPEEKRISHHAFEAYIRRSAL